MKQKKFITFTITKDEIKEVAEGNGIHNLSNEQIQSILTMVECDEMLWKDINNSIISAIKDELYS